MSTKNFSKLCSIVLFVLVGGCDGTPSSTTQDRSDTENPTPTAGPGRDDEGNEDPNGGDSGLCPLAVGSTRVGAETTYRVVSEQEEVLWNNRVLSVESVEGGEQATIETSYAIQGVPTKVTQVILCNQLGSFSVRRTTETTLTIGEVQQTLTSNVSYAPPLLNLPHDLAIGKTWTSTSTQTVSSSMNPTPEVKEVTATAEVTAKESVVVTGGTFDAWVISQTAPEATTFSVADGVGLVKSSQLELVSHTP